MAQLLVLLKHLTNEISVEEGVNINNNDALDENCYLSNWEIFENVISDNDDKVAADIEEQSSDEKENEILRPKISRADFNKFLD